MNSDQKRLVRAVVRRVHPDLFGAHPYERSRNAESLKLLNVYVDALASGRPADAGSVEFWVKEDSVLQRIEAQLPARGSLAPLFLAFGLITPEDLQHSGDYDLAVDDRNFLLWLQETVNEAVATADQHEQVKRSIRELRASIEDRLLLSAVQLGGEFAVGFAEQQRQLEALNVLDTALTRLTLQDPYRFEGLTIRLYHPDSCPFDASRFAEMGPLHMSTPVMPSYVGDDGTVHIVADPLTIHFSVAGLDLDQARLLTRLSVYWARRVRELTPALKDLLGIENVWCDTRTETSSQRFVLWAGYVLEARNEFAAALSANRYSFSLLVHSDTSAPLVDFLASSSVLQVRSDCPPRRLLEFLSSESGTAANTSAKALATGKEKEEAALEAVRNALGAKHVIRVCSSYDQDKVLEACERLVASAPTIREAVDLAGASIAIDDCYELWESGFISIPYDFRVSDLQPQLQKLLAASTSADELLAGMAGAEGEEQGAWEAVDNAFDGLSVERDEGTDHLPSVDELPAVEEQGAAVDESLGQPPTQHDDTVQWAAQAEKEKRVPAARDLQATAGARQEARAAALAAQGGAELDEVYQAVAAAVQELGEQVAAVVDERGGAAPQGTNDEGLGDYDMAHDWTRPGNGAGEEAMGLNVADLAASAAKAGRTAATTPQAVPRPRVPPALHVAPQRSGAWRGLRRWLRPSVPRPMLSAAGRVIVQVQRLA